MEDALAKWNAILDETFERVSGDGTGCGVRLPYHATAIANEDSQPR